MPLSIEQRRKIARKAVKTRKTKEEQKNKRLRAKKAVETIEESEKRYIPQLAEFLGVSSECVFHHFGLPDLMVVRSDGKIAFCEVKPKKGKPERKGLNPYQKSTAERLLKLGFEFYIAEYEGRGKSLRYGNPIRLTVDNLSKHCV